MWNSFACVLMLSGKDARDPPPGLSTLPVGTEAIGCSGGLPPRKTESLTPSLVVYLPAPDRMTVLELS
jgi:hypothetical protein